MKDYFPVIIPAKRYITKYLHATYGNPLILSANNYFGTSLIAHLPPRHYQNSPAIMRFGNFDGFDTPLKIYLPIAWAKKYPAITEIPAENIVNLNKHMEERFIEDLGKFCALHSIYGIELKDSLEQFCTRHNIEIDEDITFECLKKKEYRARRRAQSIAAGLIAM